MIELYRSMLQSLLQYLIAEYNNIDILEYYIIDTYRDQNFQQKRFSEKLGKFGFI